MKHCNFCGTDNPDTSKFCSNCGRNLEYKVSESKPNRKEERIMPASPLTTYDDTSMSVFLKVIITILLVGGLAVLILLLSNDGYSTDRIKKFLAPVYFVIIAPILKKIWD